MGCKCYHIKEKSCVHASAYSLPYLSFSPFFLSAMQERSLFLLEGKNKDTITPSSKHDLKAFIVFNLDILETVHNTQSTQQKLSAHHFLHLEMYVTQPSQKPSDRDYVKRKGTGRQQPNVLLPVQVCVLSIPIT